MQRTESAKQTGRKSGIELLRILSMLMIVGHHYSVHGGFSFSTDSITLQKLWVQWLSLGGKIGVNLFMLISGYFLINSSKIKLEKILKFLGQAFFYSVAITLFFYLTKIDGVIRLKTVIKSLFPLSSSAWWYATCYFVIYLFSPFINKLLKSLGKRKHLCLILLMTILFCVTNELIFVGGSFAMNSTAWLLYLYILAGYIRLYKDEIKIKHCILWGTLSYILTFLTAVSLDLLGLKVTRLGKVATFYFGMNTLPVLLTSVLLFIGFKNLEIKKNKIINTIAASTFGIYLLHDSVLSRHYLWTTLFKNKSYINSVNLFGHSVICILVVFFGCSAVELIRIHTIEKLWMRFVNRVCPKISKTISKGVSIIEAHF